MPAVNSAEVTRVLYHHLWASEPGAGKPYLMARESGTNTDCICQAADGLV